MEKFGKFILGSIVVAAAILARAFAIVLLWRWFIVPTFHLPVLTWQVAYGMALVISLLRPVEALEHKEEKFEARVIRTVAANVIEPWLIVLMGWIVLKIA